MKGGNLHKKVIIDKTGKKTTVWVKTGVDQKEPKKQGSGHPKSFRVNPQIGKVKHSVSHHDGVDTHKDGSPFSGISTFKNKKDLEAFTKKLSSEGYNKPDKKKSITNHISELESKDNKTQSDKYVAKQLSRLINDDTHHFFDNSIDSGERTSADDEQLESTIKKLTGVTLDQGNNDKVKESFYKVKDALGLENNTKVPQEEKDRRNKESVDQAMKQYEKRRLSDIDD